MVGDPDRVDALLDGLHGVGHSHHSLDHDLHRGVFAQPGDVLPGERLVDETGHVLGEGGAASWSVHAAAVLYRGEVAHRQVGGKNKAVAEISLSSAQHRSVHSDRESSVTIKEVRKEREGREQGRREKRSNGKCSEGKEEERSKNGRKDKRK